MLLWQTTESSHKYLNSGDVIVIDPCRDVCLLLRLRGQRSAVCLSPAGLRILATLKHLKQDWRQQTVDFWSFFQSDTDRKHLTGGLNKRIKEDRWWPDTQTEEWIDFLYEGQMGAPIKTLSEVALQCVGFMTLAGHRDSWRTRRLSSDMRRFSRFDCRLCSFTETENETEKI